MKQKLKKLTKLRILLFGISLLFTNCNKDNNNITELESKNNFNVTIINNLELDSSSLLTEKLNRIKNKRTASKNDVYNQEYDFTILTEKVKYTENLEGTFHSYSFPIERENPENNNLENLVIFLNAEGTYSSMLVQYGFTAEEYKNIEQNIENSTSVYALIDVDETLLNISSKRPYVCVEEWEYIAITTSCEGQLHGVGCGHEPEGGSWTLVSMDCEFFFGGTSNYGTFGDYNPYGNQQGNTTGTSNSGTSNVGVASSPTVPLTMAEKLSNFITLTPEQEFWANKQEQELITEITTFLLINCGQDNTSSECQEANTFAQIVIGSNGEIDFEELFIETPTPDDDYIYQGSKSQISDPLILDNGDEISIDFGTTASDNQSADQEVSIDLISALKFAVEHANDSLDANEQIESLYIMATTNGSHSPTSNHSNGTAMDISRINGVKMAVSGVTNQIKELQIAFDAYIFIRENFGPHFKHKFFNSNGTWNYNYPIGGHKEHTYIS